MTLPTLKEQKFGIYGIQGSGKSHFAKYHIVNKLFPGRAWVLTSLPYEWKDPNIECFYTEVHSLDEIEQACGIAKKKAEEGKLKLLLIDEADEWFRTNWDVTQNFRELVLKHRHYHLALGLITRRPQDIPHVIVGSCHAHFVFKLEDPYAIRMFEQFNPKMPELIQGLSYKDFQCVVKTIGEEPFVTKPV